MIEKNPVKVVLDSDVIIHFIKGGCLNLLPTILPTYSFIILDIVYQKELANSHKTIIENTVHFLKSISIEKWEITSKEEKEEFISLQKKRGLGESVSMVYCKYNKNVLASSNLRVPVKKMSEFAPRLQL